MTMDRREFLLGSAAAALVGCRATEATSADAVCAEMRRLVAQKLYRGLVCCSNRVPVVAEGFRTLSSDGGPVTANSLFDLASVGKTQTASLCALLYAAGRLDPDAPFTEYLPEHVLAKENCKITVRDLATHSGGFDNAKPYATPDPVKYFERLYGKRPVRPRGEKFCYACSNFVYLGLIVEKLTGLDLDAAARKMLWGPLGMAHTTWNTVVGNPDAVEFPESTYRWCESDPPRRIGEHNDVCAHWAPRPMGNGSCFSTAPDMRRFCTDLLRREKFPKAYYDLLLTPSFAGDGHRRSFGWEMTAPSSSFSDWTPTRFSDAAVCHSGWTGPAIAVDPRRDFAGVVLGNRLAGKEDTMGPRMRLLDLMADVGHATL